VTPLPASLGGTGLIAWRLDHDDYKTTWDSGEGPRRAGGRWNGKGQRVVYCALDPATAILEVAVHKSFYVLDTVPHVLTSLAVVDPASVHIVQPHDIPNNNWLRPGIPGAGQQHFGNQLVASHKFVVIPSTVSTHSWNLIFDPERATGAYQFKTQEKFALDTRLNPIT
jgi:RES domain-containing protein